MTNRFKGLDLVNRVPEELWEKVCNTVQEVVNKIIPKKKKSKKAKWLSEEALQIVEERSEVKSKGERESYTQLNRVPKKSKERQEGLLQGTLHKNRGKQQKGKISDLFRKIGNIKEHFAQRWAQ